MPVAAIPAIAIGATLLSGAAAGAGAVMSAHASAQAANYNAAVADANAKQSATTATSAIAQGDVAAQQQQDIGAAKMGGLIAAYGANNIETNSGSALNAKVSLADTTARNVSATQYNANATAVSALNQGKGDTAQAGLLQMQASNDTTAGYVSAGTSLLSSASQVSPKWSFMQQGVQF